MKKIKIRDLPPNGLHYTGDDGNETIILKLPDGTPECRFTTPWILGKGGCFRVYLTIVGPKTEKVKGALSLSGRQAEDAVQKIAHMVKAFKKRLL